jgi:hypothetical protein
LLGDPAPLDLRFLRSQRAAVDRCLHARTDTGSGLSPTLRSPGAAQRLAEMLATIWAEVVAPSWPQVCECLECDIAYRSRALAAAGLAAVLDDLGASLTLETAAG